MRWREVQANLTNEAQVRQYGDQCIDVLLAHATVCHPPGVGAGSEMDAPRASKLLRRTKVASGRHGTGEKREPKLLSLCRYLLRIFVEV